jgi:hypothetical protein
MEDSAMRAILGVAVIVVLVLIAGLWLGLLRVDQTREATLPKVSVSGGQTPKFSVETAKVNVGTTQTTIDVPKVDTEKKAVNLPAVSVEKPAQ